MQRDAPAMDNSLDVQEIPTLVFGGRSGLPYAKIMVIALNPDVSKSRAWVRSILDDIVFGAARCTQVAAIGFTAEGLHTKLGLTGTEMASFPTAFQSGMVSPGRSRVLGDTEANDPRHWLWGRADQACDALLAIYATSEHALDLLAADHTRRLTLAGCAIMRAVALQPIMRGASREPFGFRDGVSQPLLRGSVRANRQPHSAHHVAPGELVLGYDTNSGHRKISPWVTASRDPLNILPPLQYGQGYGHHDLGRNGTFLVARQLEQDVEAFERVCTAGAMVLAKQGAMPDGLSPDEQRKFVAAKMIGRWQDGSSLARHPNAPGGRPDNDFLFAQEDPYGLSCPLGAHIRRANPRDSLLPGVSDPLTITNTHRLLRVGRSYSPMTPSDKVGIFFMCINTDIELQFEVVQQTWLMRADFHGLRDETDPILGCADKARRYTVPSPDGPGRLAGLENFVKVLGGAYFFMPGRAALRFLCTEPGEG